MVSTRLPRAVAVISLAALLPAILCGPVIGAAPSAPSGSDPSLWAWVTARQPTSTSYTPGPRDQGSSSGGTNTVQRIGTGSYVVTFGTIFSTCTGEGCYGSFQVTALSDRQRHCGLQDWALGPVDSPTSIRVDVVCRMRTGNVADSAFSLGYLALRDTYGSVAYLFNNDPENEAYDPRPEYNFSAGIGHNEILRLGTGAYRAFLPGMHAGSRGDLQVNSPWAVCRPTDRFDEVDAAYVHVRCRDPFGDPVDASFSLLYLDGVGSKGVPTQSAAYLWANRPTADSYHPAPAFRYSSAGTVPTVVRTGIGSYRATLPGMALGGTAQVTAYGTGKAACQLSGIRTITKPQRIGVLCFKPNGDPVDSRFSLTFTR